MVKPAKGLRKKPKRREIEVKSSQDPSGTNCVQSKTTQITIKYNLTRVWSKFLSLDFFFFSHVFTADHSVEFMCGGRFIGYVSSNLKAPTFGYSRWQHKQVSEASAS